ncbi:MAG: S-layer homology domain-containing protein, partial [Pelosinus sp.]|nr:S-layer homology domain-containing protein [Pelosinus sp.]
PAAGGNVTGGGTYNENASVTAAATANSGYTFVNWTEGGSEVSASASYTFTLGTTNRTLVANFTATSTPTYALTITAGTGGSISSGSSGNYAAGAVINIAATASANYSFNKWTSSDGGTFDNPYSTATTFTMPAESAAITANFTHNGGGGGSGGGSASNTPQPVNSTNGSALISPAAGGTVSSGSDVTLQIPANALQGSESAQVTIQKMDEPAAVPAGFMLMGTVYQFSVNGQDHYNFNQPVTLTFTFDPSKLAPGEKPAVNYYDEGKGQWVNIGGTVSGYTITVTVDHFTKFAVIVGHSVSPMQKPAVALTDITGHWAEPNINSLVSMGAISGYPDGTFKPDNTITRAEFAAILAKAFKLQEKEGKVFTDTTDHWAKDFIATAAASGIIGGYDQNTFGPDDPVTREQMALMTVKAAKLNPASGELAFTDSAQISSWANNAVLTAVKKGIIKGYPDNTFRPQGKAARAEAVTLIISAINK